MCFVRSDVVTDQSHALTDPNGSPVKVINDDWSVSPEHRVLERHQPGPDAHRAAPIGAGTVSPITRKVVRIACFPLYVSLAAVYYA